MCSHAPLLAWLKATCWRPLLMPQVNLKQSHCCHLQPITHTLSLIFLLIFFFTVCWWLVHLPSKCTYYRDMLARPRGNSCFTMLYLDMNVKELQFKCSISIFQERASHYYGSFLFAKVNLFTHSPSV